MFWKLAIQKNRQALAQIVAGLWRLVDPSSLRGRARNCDQQFRQPENARPLDGEQEADKPNLRRLSPMVARHLATAIRKVETALRRVIVLYMSTQNLKPVAATKDPASLPDFASFKKTASTRIPSFNLFDPRKPMVFFFDEDSSSLSLSSNLVRRSRSEPRILFSHLPSFGVCVADRIDPRVKSAHDGAWDGEAEHKRSAEKLLRRLAALDRALGSIPQQARRLARIMEKREKAPPGPGVVPPIRSGIPPGFCDRGKDEIDLVLRECHGLVRDWEGMRMRVP